MKQDMKNLLKSRFKVWWLVFVLTVGLLGSTVVFADDTPSYLSIDADSKQITVSNDSSTTDEIVKAIEYISENASSGDSWTVLVETGLYSTYTVPDNVSVTVKAKDSTQTVAVSDDIGYSVDQTGISVDTSSKTITVTDVEDESYEIQNAIDYVVTQNDITGWTITVNSGTYSRFVVYDGMNNLTIKAAYDADVVVNVLDGSEMQIIDYTFISNTGKLSYYYYDANNISESNVKNEYRSDHWQQGYYDNDGVVIMDVDGLEISGIEFKIGTITTGLYSSAISTYQSAADSLCPNDFTIDSCTFTGSGYDITDVTSADISYGIFVCTAANEASNWTVTNCTFTDLYCGVEIMNDNNWVGTVNITNNYFKDCDRAVDGYFGNSRVVLDQSDWGTFTFTGNTVIGNSNEYCKILLGDDVSTWTSDYYKRDYDAFGYVVLSDNTLSYAEFLLFGIEDVQLGDADLLETNTYETCAFVVKGSEGTYSAEINFVMNFESDEDDTGYWAYLGNTTLSSYYYVGRNWTAAEYAIVVAAIEEANATGSHTLTLDFSSLYDKSSSTYDSEYSDGNSWEWTVVCLKYGIRWVSVENTSIYVQKVWDDDDDANGLRPDSVIVELYADGEATGETLTLSEENDWCGAFANLATYDYDDYSTNEDGVADGVAITYTVVENVPDGYTATYSDLTGSISEGYEIVITNASDDDDDDSVQTSDNSNIAMMGIILMMAIAGCAGVAVSKRR